MRNISNMLYNGNLTAREKFLMLIQNDISKAKTGKEILTPADKDALENWKATNDSEARVWNRLNEGWKHSGRVEIEAELAYKDAHISYLAMLPIIMRILSYPSNREIARSIQTLESLKKVTIGEATEIAAKQKAAKLNEGMDFDYAVYQLAFELLDEVDRKRLVDLYQDIKTDHQYLDQEEIIAHLFDGKSELTKEAKEKLSELVAEWSYNKFAKEYQLFHYFACIPILEMAKYFLKNKGIGIEGKPLPENQEWGVEDGVDYKAVTTAIEIYADKHHTTVRDFIKEACLEMLDDDLLERYTPLIISNDKELFERWLKTKIQARDLLYEYIGKKELEIRTRTEQETRKEKLYSKGQYKIELEIAQKAMENINLETIVKGELEEKVAFETFSDTVITGKSLYDFKGHYDFIKNFKDRADKYDPNLGLVYADDDPEHKGEHLDQELIICDVNEKGEPIFFSHYGLSLLRLKAISEGKMLFEEKVEDGRILITFKDVEIEHAFKERRKDLIEGFAKLLAYEELIKKLSKEYEVDLTFHITERVKKIREFMEQNNEAILQATNADSVLSRKKHDLFKRKDILHFEGGLIDIEEIKPDMKAVEEHEKKLKNILGNF